MLVCLVFLLFPHITFKYLFHIVYLLCVFYVVSLSWVSLLFHCLLKCPLLCQFVMFSLCKCIFTVHFCPTVTLHASFHAGYLCVMSCLSNCQFLSLKWVLISSNVSVILSLDSRSLRYCSDVMGVTFMCLLFLIISNPVYVMHILYEQSLWPWSPLSTIIPWVHCPQSSL